MARRWAGARARRPRASSACATWPASSWGRRTTTRPAPSTASPSVGLSVYQLPGTNALDVAERVRAKMEELKTRFPDGVDYEIAYDTTPFIRESVADVVQTLLEAVVLVGVVVLVVPAELAGGDHSADRRAGRDHRHLRRHGGRWGSA